MTVSPHRRDRREVNPALGRRKLKLGTFQTNLDSGCVMSDLDGRLDLTWPNTVTLAQFADEMDFEALVPVACWRDQERWRDLDLARCAQSSDHRGQAIHGDRPHFQRPLHAQYRQWLELSGNGDVRRQAARSRRALRLR